MRTSGYFFRLGFVFGIALISLNALSGQNHTSEKPAILMIHGLAGSDETWQTLIKYLPSDKFEYCGNFDIDKPGGALFEGPLINFDLKAEQSETNSDRYKIFTLRFHDNVGLDFEQQGIRARMVVDTIVKTYKRDVVLVGHSMGGLSSRACIMRDPSNIAGLVTAASPHVGSYCGLVYEYYENNKLDLTELEKNKIEQFVQLALKTGISSPTNRDFLASYALFWNDIKYVDGSSILDELIKAPKLSLKTYNAEVGNFLLPIFYDNLKLNSKAVKSLIPYSDEMMLLYDQELPVDLPVSLVLSKWDDDLYQDLDTRSIRFADLFFPQIKGHQIIKDEVTATITDIGREAMAFVPEVLRLDYATGDRNIYPGNGQYFEFTDGVVTVYSQDIRNGIKNGDALRTVGYFGSNRFHTKVTRDTKTMEKAIQFVLNNINSKKGSIKIGLILDSSGSMLSSDPLDVRKRAAESIIDILKADDEVFIVDFDSHAKFLNRNQTRIDSSFDLKAYIRQIDSNGGTDIGAGLSGMTEAILSGEEMSFNSTGVLLLTDGQGNYNDEASWYQNNNIPIYTVSYKQNADASLMDKIADKTGGVYVQADDKDDVIHAFMQFYYGVSGNSTIFREEVTADGVYETGVFHVDESAENMIIYLANLNFDPSSIEFFAPGQEPMLLSDIPDLVIGDDYLFARTPIISAGEYNIRVSPVIAQQFRDEMWSVSAGGPSPGISFSSAPVNFVIEVSTDTKLDVDLAIEDSKNGYYEIEFIADEDEVKLSQSSVEMEVTSPAGEARKYSKGYKNGKISFVPMEGKGNYKLKAAFKGIDAGGNAVNRHYFRSVLVGDFQPGYIGEVDRIMGNYIYTSQGLLTQNRPGITVEVFNRSSGIQNPIGKGYVTEVLENSCIIELQEVYGEVEEGDLVILDLLQWKGDN